MVEKVEGIILRETNYGDTSKVLEILTKKYGLIGVMSKGCRSLKSLLRSTSTKLTYGYFYIYYKENKLSILKSVDIINIFKNIKTDIEKISYSSYLLELSSSTYKQSLSSDIYPLLISSLIKIDNDFDSLVITNILELKYLNYLGVMPYIDGCVKCFNKDNIVTLSSKDGGYLCSKCHTNEYLTSLKTIKLIRLFYYVNIDKIDKIDIDFKEKLEINNFLSEYYNTYTGLYIKSKDFIEKLTKI